MSRFEEGRQPCDDYDPKTGGLGLPNEHECFCPFDGTTPCDLKVSWCWNCRRDHHEGGSESCKGCNQVTDMQDTDSDVKLGVNSKATSNSGGSNNGN